MPSRFLTELGFEPWGSEGEESSEFDEFSESDDFDPFPEDDLPVWT